MFGDYSLSELGSIFVMQGFAGLSLFCVLLLMALGLAIIFGQMGVINMAHGEFMTIGAYTHLHAVAAASSSTAPSLLTVLLLRRDRGGVRRLRRRCGLLVEWVLIRHLYKRPLDTLLATWGLSLIMQQAFRSIFGAREVSADAARLADGLVKPIDGSIDIPINGLFVMGLTAADHRGRVLRHVPLALGPAGARRRAEPRHGRRGRHQHRQGRPPHLRPRLRHRRHRRRGLHHDRLDRADQRVSSTSSTPSWWWCSAAPRACSAPSPRPSRIAQTQSTLEFFLTGSMAKVLTLLGDRRDPDDAAARAVRPQGAASDRQ